MAYTRTHETTERETPVFVAHVRGELVAQSFWCGLGGPQPQRVIPAGRDGAASVGTERDTGHVAGMPGERVGDGLAGSAFHTRASWSALALASRCPLGLNATLVTCWPCPLSQARGVKFSLKIWTGRSRDR
jgi:hypothetical protein